LISFIGNTLIYKTSYGKYTTMLRHAEGLRQTYDKIVIYC